MMILVVDDDVDTCRNLTDILTDLGCRVDTAHDGPSALERVRKKRYYVALLDLKMPGMDGLTLYREIKKLSAGTVAIIVTAYATSATADNRTGDGSRGCRREPTGGDNRTDAGDGPQQMIRLRIIDLGRARQVQFQLADLLVEGVDQPQVGADAVPHALEGEAVDEVGVSWGVPLAGWRAGATNLQAQCSRSWHRSTVLSIPASVGHRLPVGKDFIAQLNSA